MKRTSIKGKNVMIFVGGKAIALATSCTMEINADTEDSATKDDGGWSSDEVVGHNWTASSDSVVGADPTTPVDVSYTELTDLCLAGTIVTIIYGAAANASDGEVPEAGWTVPTSGYQGKAIIDKVSRTDANKQKSTMTVSFKGTGALTKIA